MTKLLQIVVEGNRGSTGTIAESIGELVLKQGWKSYIAHGRFPRSSSSQIIRIGSSLEILIHGITTRLFDRHGLGSCRATRVLIKKIEKIKPDIVHLHHLHGYYINIEILFNYLSNANLPTVWTFHDCWAITGHCCYFDYVGCQKWKTNCHHCPQKKEYPASLFIDRSKKNFYLKKKLFTSVSNMMIVTVSEWLDSIVGNSFLADTPRKIIFNGVNVDLYKKTPLMKSQATKKSLKIGDGFMILGVANTWEERKGFNDFMRLSKRIGRNDFIVLVGLRKSQIKNLPNNVIGIIRTESMEKLRDLYAAADVYLNLSVEETFGLTTAEALSCGTPAIVYNATACPEVLDVNTGFVVNKNDIDGLLESIEGIRKNGKEFYSSQCRERAIKYYNRVDRLSEYLEMYKQMIAG
ncbi:MAG TPA: glycosyl transferase [Bacteroidales bacterium]|nr:glycosyl transferase [Bacteroidales bacterium]